MFWCCSIFRIQHHFIISPILLEDRKDNCIAQDTTQPIQRPTASVFQQLFVDGGCHVVPTHCFVFDLKSSFTLIRDPESNVPCCMCSYIAFFCLRFFSYTHMFLRMQYLTRDTVLHTQYTLHIIDLFVTFIS